MAEFDAVFLVDAILLLLAAATAVAVIQLRSLFSATMLAGVYSLIMALVWSNMHALDVAFTEAAVGAGIYSAAAYTLRIEELTAVTSRVSRRFRR